MIRRKLLRFFFATLGFSLFTAFESKTVFAFDLFSKIRKRLSPLSAAEPAIDRKDAILPEEGQSISVETALNSRCTGDYDNNPREIHWGMFDKGRKLSTEQIEHIRATAIIPRFTNANVTIQTEKNILTFTTDNPRTRPHRDWLMVESGMQQQAVGLVCAALGAGYVFNTLGVEGKSLSSHKYATTRIKLESLKPSYHGAYWTNEAPTQPSPRASGNLADPVRKGTLPLITALAELKTAKGAGKQATTNDLGQLLWAARGRTPHFSISSPWGMTIPTYNVKEIITNVHVIYGDDLYRYDNGKPGSPAHTLQPSGKIAGAISQQLKDQFKPSDLFIVLSINNNQAKSLWEIGYQLLNLLLQAHSLNIAYKAILLNEDQKQTIRNAGIKEPVAVLCITRNWLKSKEASHSKLSFTGQNSL